MADYSGTGFDPSSYNSESAAQQVALQRALAQQLMQKQVQTQGQVVPGGPNGFYVKPSALGQFGSALQEGLGALIQSKANDQQKKNDKDSQAALEYQLKHLNDQVDNGSTVQYDAPVTSTPGWTGPANGDGNGNAPSAVPPMPQAAPQGATTTPLPPPPQTQGSPLPPSPAPQQTPAPLPVRPGQQTSGPSAVQQQAISTLARSGKGYVAPPVTPPDPSDVQSLLKVTNEKGTFTVPDTLANRWEYRNKFTVVPLIQDKNSAPTPPAQPPVSPQVLAAQMQKPPGGQTPAPPQAAAPAPSPAPVPQQGPPSPSAVPPMPQAAPQPPQGPQAMPPIDHSLDPISTTTQRANVVQNMQAPDQATQISRLAQLANTGKVGQMVASSALSSMGPQKDRFEPVKNSDGEVQGIFDKYTGRMVQGGDPSGTSNKTTDMDLKLRASIDPNNQAAVAGYNQWRVTKGLAPLKPEEIAGSNMTADQRASQTRQDQTQKKDLAKEHESYQSGISGIQGQLAQLDRMDQLYDKTFTGPIIGGKLPAWTNDRQELKNLTGSNVFAGVREAVDGAGGGSQRFTQGELQHFANGNGGLSLDTNPEVAHNIIAQQRAVLQSKLKALQAADSGTPSTGGQVSVPARGQTFNGPNAAAASALGIQ